jgi:hypothetical protein
MPNLRFTAQKYTCKSGHTTEVVIEDSKRFKTQKCRVCGKRAEHVFIVQRNALPQSTIVYEKPGEGGRMERLYVDPAAPESLAYAESQGFQRREIQGIHAMRRFEKEVTQEMKSDYDRAQRGEAKHREEFNKRYCDDLRGLMNDSRVHPWWRELFQAAIEDRNSQSSSRDYSPEFRNAAYS